jgi:hypothetical protein
MSPIIVMMSIMLSVTLFLILVMLADDKYLFVSVIRSVLFVGIFVLFALLWLSEQYIGRFYV